MYIRVCEPFSLIVNYCKIIKSSCRDVDCKFNNCSLKSYKRFKIIYLLAPTWMTCCCLLIDKYMSVVGLDVDCLSSLSIVRS